MVIVNIFHWNLIKSFFVVKFSDGICEGWSSNECSGRKWATPRRKGKKIFLWCCEGIRIQYIYISHSFCQSLMTILWKQLTFERGDSWEVLICTVHSKQIIHRDIKPDNLLVSEDDSIKICDFSVSQMFDQPDDRLTYSAGSPIFLAPELCAGYFSSLSLSLPHSHSLSLSICFSFVMLNILMCCTCWRKMWKKKY